MGSGRGKSGRRNKASREIRQIFCPLLSPPLLIASIESLQSIFSTQRNFERCIWFVAQHAMERGRPAFDLRGRDLVVRFRPDPATSLPTSQRLKIVQSIWLLCISVHRAESIPEGCRRYWEKYKFFNISLLYKWKKQRIDLLWCDCYHAQHSSWECLLGGV